MKGSKTAANVLAGVSFIGLVYCLAGYLYIQPRLVPSFAEPTLAMQVFGKATMPVLLMVGVYHIVLLVRAFRSLADREGRVLLHSAYIVAVVLSGLNLVTDVTLLSDIGKEYLHWDVTDQWWILYAFTALHLAVVAYGFLSGVGPAKPGTTRADEVGGGRDALYLSMHQIAILCGLTGIIAVVALPGMVPERFRTLWLLFLTILAVFPLVVFATYLLIRNRRKPIATWFDEKQTADMAAGALVSVFTVMPLLVLISVVEAFARLEVPRSFWPLLVLFAHLMVLSGVALARSRAA